MGSKKMGRPVSESPKCNDIKVRVDDQIHERLLNYCKTHNITKAEAVRKAIVEMLEK